MLVEALGKETTAGQVALAIKKTLALAEIGINLEKQLNLNAIAVDELKAIPIVGPALGTAYEITEDTLAITGAAASAAKMLGFNTGGIVPGAGNTDSVPALLTPGEVMSQGASQQYSPLLSYLNAQSGGVNFAPGFTPSARVASPTDGGLVARSLVGRPTIDYRQLAVAIAQQPIFVKPSEVVGATASRAARIARVTLS